MRRLIISIIGLVLYMAAGLGTLKWAVNAQKRNVFKDGVKDSEYVFAVVSWPILAPILLGHEVFSKDGQPTKLLRKFMQ